MPGYLLTTALRPESTLRPHVKNGIGAFSKQNKKVIPNPQRTKIGDSLDLDSATMAEFPTSNRWDYIVSIPESRKMVGIEPHSASNKEISVVIAKKRAAMEYLRTHLKPGHRVESWFWVSRGRVLFSQMERARRLLDQNGIEFSGRNLRLP